MKRTIACLLTLIMLTCTACSTSNTATSPTIAVSAVILSSESLDMTVGETHDLRYTILPKDATNRSVTWQSSNNRIVEVTYGSVVAKQPGKATITVYTDNGVVAKCYITVQQKSAYSRLSSEEKEFVDLFVLYARGRFLDPSSITIKTITDTYVGDAWWIQLSAKNNLGGISVVKYYLDDTGLWDGGTHHSSELSKMNVDLINEAIQEKI